MNLEEIRKQYPQYNDLSDAQLANGLYEKHYSDMPFDDFAKRIGYERKPFSGAGGTFTEPPKLTPGRIGGAVKEGLKDVAKSSLNAIGQIDRVVLEGMAKAERKLGFPERSDALSKFAKELPGGMMEESKKILAPNPDYYESSGYIEDFARSAPQMGSQVVATLLGGPFAGMGLMGLQIAGGTYENLKAQGVDDDRALAAGVANAIMQAPLEQIGVGKITSLFKVNKAIIQKLKGIAEAAGTEWLTEFTQAYPELLANVWAKNPDAKMSEQWNKVLDGVWEATKQGAYEGTLTAPWALLGLAGGKTMPALTVEGTQEIPGQPTPKPPAYTPEQRAGVLEQIKAGIDDGTIGQGHIDVIKQKYPDLAFDVQDLWNQKTIDDIINTNDISIPIEDVYQEPLQPERPIETPEEFLPEPEPTRTGIGPEEEPVIIRPTETMGPRREEPPPAPEAPRFTTYDEAQKAIDAFEDELIKAGRKDELYTNPELEKLYAERNKIGQKELEESYKDISKRVNEVLKDEELTKDVLKRAYDLDLEDTSGQYFASKYTKQDVLNEKETVEKITRKLIAKETGMGDHEIDVLFSDLSPLTSKGKRDLVERNTRKAEDVNNAMKNYFGIEKMERTPEPKPQKPGPEAPISEGEAITKAFNEKTPEHDLVFQGEWETTPGEAPIYQFTAQQGPVKGATFTTRELSENAIQEAVDRKIEEFKPKEKATEAPPKAEGKEAQEIIGTFKKKIKGTLGWSDHDIPVLSLSNPINVRGKVTGSNWMVEYETPSTLGGTGKQTNREYFAKKFDAQKWIDSIKGKQPAPPGGKGKEVKQEGPKTPSLEATPGEAGDIVPISRKEYESPQRLVEKRIEKKYSDILNVDEGDFTNEALSKIDDGELTPKELDDYLKSVDNENKPQEIRRAKSTIADQIGDLIATHKYEGHKEGAALEEYIDSLLEVVKANEGGPALPEARQVLPVRPKAETKPVETKPISSSRRKNPSKKVTPEQPPILVKEKAGRVWLNDQWRPFTEWEEVKKGKNKGKVRVTVAGKKKLVDKSAVKEWPEGKEAPKIEVKPEPKKKVLPIGEVVAKDVVGGNEYEFRVGKFSDPSMPQMKYQIEMRQAGSTGEWEPAGVGKATSKKDALRFLAERYDRIGKDLEKLQVFDDTLQKYIDKEIQAKKERETDRTKQEAEKEQKRQEELKQVEEMRSREPAIAEAMKKAKAKKGKIQLLNGEREPLGEPIDALSFGDYAYHKKIGNNPNNEYTVTHVPSGMSVSRTGLTAKEARELAYRYSLIKEKWDGKGNPPKAIYDILSSTFTDFTNREPIKILISKLKSEKGDIEIGSGPYKDLQDVAAEVYQSGKTKFSQFHAEMKRIFAEVWDKIKRHMMRLFTAAKKYAKSERGSIGIEEEVKAKAEETPEEHVDKLISDALAKVAEKETKQAEEAGNAFGGSEKRVNTDRAREAIMPHVNDFIYWIVDKNRPIEVIQSRLKKTGEDIDLFLSETQRPKITAAKVKEAWTDKIRPFLKSMANNGIEIADFEEYAHAKHAHEANIVLRNANAKRYVEGILSAVPSKESKAFREDIKEDLYPEEWYARLQEAFDLFGDNKDVHAIKESWDKFSEKPSGMTDAEATKILKANSGNEAIEKLRIQLLQINDERLEILKEAGLIHEKEYDAMKNRYKYYVPLYREGFEGQTQGTGKGLQPAGRPVKTRMGSTKNVVSIVAHSVSNYENAINRAEKAHSAKVFFDLIRSNPDPGLWSITKVKMAPRHDNVGNIRLYPDIFNVAPNEMRIMVDGNQYLISVDRNNKDAMLMLKTLKAEEAMGGPFIGALSKLNRFLARVNTSWSPEFIISNFLRDLQTAGINIKDTGVESKRMFRGALESAKAIYNVERNKRTGSALETTYERFKLAGGKIGWKDVHGSIENLAKKITAEVKTLSGHRPIRKNINQWLQWVEDANTSIENGVRLHAFKLAIDQGISDKKAAQIASDLTVDFTKKGAAGPAINAMYLFANAGIQGSYRIFRAGAKSSKVRKIMGGIIGLGFTVGLLNSGFGGKDDDDEDYYNKIPDYVRERNMIFMLPGTKGKYAKIPLPWGYNLFWNFGDELSKVFTKNNYKPTAGAGRMASVFVQAFNPIQAGTLLQTLSPTVLDPFAQVAENKNWFGGDLMPPKDKFEKVPTPDSQRYWKSARTQSKWIARQLNTLTGGNKVRPGKIDISPETLDLFVDTIGGSALRFVQDTFGVPERLLRKEEIEVFQVPFARRVFGQKTSRADMSKYYENVTEILTAKQELNEYKGTKYYDNLKTSLAKEKKLIPFAELTERRLRHLRKLRNRAELKNKKSKVKELNDRINKIYLEFNKKYNSIVSRKAANE